MDRLLRGMVLMALLLAVAVMLAACSRSGADRGRMTNSSSAPLPLTGVAARGQLIYADTCAHCHGDNATGLPNLGKDLTTSEFVVGQTDQQLIDFIKRGRLPGDPANTTGIPMPPKGGNPGLTDQDLANVVAYIRALHQ
jgi:disulfide bond formation protein DsbB